MSKVDTFVPTTTYIKKPMSSSVVISYLVDTAEVESDLNAQGSKDRELHTLRLSQAINPCYDKKFILNLLPGNEDFKY